MLMHMYVKIEMNMNINVCVYNCVCEFICVCICFCLFICSVFFLCLVNLYICIIVHLYSRVSICNYVQLKICHLKIGIGYWCFVFGIWYLVFACVFVIVISFAFAFVRVLTFGFLEPVLSGCFSFVKLVSAEAKHFCSPMKVTIALLFLHCYLQVSLLSCHRMSMQRTGLRLYKVSSVQDALCAKHKTVSVWKKCMCKSA